jgi:hypothetical protein
MAQAAHAATAVMHVHEDHPDVKAYLAGENGQAWRGMRKTVMEVRDEDALRRLCAKLDGLEPKIPYHLWVEQP